VMRRFMAITFFLIMSTVAQAQTATDASGTWRGRYFAGANTGDCTLIVKQSGQNLAGTIQVTGVTRSFGDAPQEISDGRSIGRKVTFKAVGVDSGFFSADFSLNRDGTVIDGWGRHTGPGYDSNVQFQLKRTE
jgi:hypothetical protein